MKKRPINMSPSTGQPDRQRRRISKLIAAITVLGPGLGVNMSEVFAEDKRPSSDDFKWDRKKAQQPGTQQFKVESQAPTHPGATQAKPVPAKPGVSQDKYAPPAKHGKMKGRPGARMHKDEAKPSADMLKGER